MAVNVHVAVRVRPFNKREIKLGCECVVSMKGTCTTVQAKPTKSFTFDASYWSFDPEAPNHAPQEVLMQDIGVGIIQNALSGYNGCLFAYGQTGSGKTYSLLGECTSPGIIPQIVDGLFAGKTALEQAPNTQLRIWTSYVEIYNDHLHDLLAVSEGRPTGSKHDIGADRLTIRDHPKLGVYVPGLISVPCETIEEVQRLVAFGHKQRAIAATAMNDHSSRSHAVFILKVTRLEGQGKEDGGVDSSMELHARINLVDLAGAERQSKVGADGVIFKQGCAINKGLSCLALVIKELSETQNKNKNSPICTGIPFRASKLTWLLKDSLAGNSRTHMLANISPAGDNMQETLSTLRFAASVKTIRTVVFQNKCARDELISSLRKELEALRSKLDKPEEPDVRRRNSLQMMEKVALMEEFGADWNEQIKAARRAQEVREGFLKHDMAVSADGIHTAFGVEADTPYLLNMSACPMLEGCLLYYIPMGQQRTIGSGSQNAICLNALGVPEHLCIIENFDNLSLSLERISQEGRVMVNGSSLRVGAARNLQNGDQLQFGHSVSLRAFLPKAGQISEHEEAAGWPEIHDDDAFEMTEGMIAHICPFLDRLDPKESEIIKKEMRRAARMCAEANEITQKCRPNGPRFEPTMICRTPFSVGVAVVPDGSTEQMYFFWNLSQMAERLDTMMEHYQIWTRHGYLEIDEIDDPWVEVHQADVWARVRDLQVRLEDAREQIKQIEIRRHLLDTGFLQNSRTSQNSFFRKFAFIAWKQFASFRRRSAVSPSGRKIISALTYANHKRDKGHSFNLSNPGRRSVVAALPHRAGLRSKAGLITPRNSRQGRASSSSVVHGPTTLSMGMGTTVSMPLIQSPPEEGQIFLYGNEVQRCSSPERTGEDVKEENLSARRSKNHAHNSVEEAEAPEFTGVALAKHPRLRFRGKGGRRVASADHPGSVTAAAKGFSVDDSTPTTASHSPAAEEASFLGAQKLMSNVSPKSSNENELANSPFKGELTSSDASIQRATWLMGNTVCRGHHSKNWAAEGIIASELMFNQPRDSSFERAVAVSSKTNSPRCLPTIVPPPPVTFQNDAKEHKPQLMQPVPSSGPQRPMQSCVFRRHDSRLGKAVCNTVSSPPRVGSLPPAAAPPTCTRASTGGFRSMELTTASVVVRSPSDSSSSVGSPRVLALSQSLRRVDLGGTLQEYRQVSAEPNYHQRVIMPASLPVTAVRPRVVNIVHMLPRQPCISDQVGVTRLLSARSTNAVDLSSPVVLSFGPAVARSQSPPKTRPAQSLCSQPAAFQSLAKASGHIEQNWRPWGPIFCASEVTDLEREVSDSTATGGSCWAAFRRWK